MVQIVLKRVYDDYNENDGLRVLVDKLWPRGIKKEDLNYDLWEKDITPSSELRKWYHEYPVERWNEFVERYREELKNSDSLNRFIEKIKRYSKVTLLYAAKDKEHNHAKILKEFLNMKLESS